MRTNHTPPLATGGLPKLFFPRAHPTAMAPYSAEQLAGTPPRAKSAWWPHHLRTAASTRTASPLTPTLKHSCHIRVVCVSLAPIPLLLTHTP